MMSIAGHDGAVAEVFARRAKFFLSLKSMEKIFMSHINVVLDFAIGTVRSRSTVLYNYLFYLIPYLNIYLFIHVH